MENHNIINRIIKVEKIVLDEVKRKDVLIINLTERVRILESLQEENFKIVLDTLSYRLVNWIEQEVRKQLSDEGIRLKINKITESMIDRLFIFNLSESISRSIVSSLGKSLTYELNKMKDISLSIDTEIKHINMQLPMSYDDSKKVVDRINKVIDNEVSLLLKRELKKIELK